MMPPCRDQPDHEDRPHLDDLSLMEDVGDRLLEDQAAPAARARRGAGGDLGRAAPAAARPGRPAKLTAKRCLADQVMDVTGDALDAGVLQFARAPWSARAGSSSTDDQRLNVRNVQTIVDAGASCAGAGRASGTARVCAWATSAGARGPHAALGRRGHQRRPRPAAVVQKFRGANTMEVTHGRRGRDGRDAARPARHRDRHDDLPAGDVHRAVDRQPHDGAAARRPARHPDHRRVPVRVAHGVHQPDRDPAVAASRRCSCSTCAARRST